VPPSSRNRRRLPTRGLIHAGEHNPVYGTEEPLALVRTLAAVGGSQGLSPAGPGDRLATGMDEEANRAGTRERRIAKTVDGALERRAQR